ncbi:transcription-repair-coupling factor [Nitrospira sp.]|nr:transcription-repair-coupling factor [Nitrospira sp.]
MSHIHPSTYWRTLFQPIRDALLNAGARACVSGLIGSAASFVVTILARDLSTLSSPRSLLLVTGTDEAAEVLEGDLRFFHSLLGHSDEVVQFFPAWEMIPYEPTAPHVDLVAQRMRALHHMTERKPCILVTSVRALVQKIMPRALFREASIHLRVNHDLSREQLLSGLLRLGYRQASVVEIPGEFSVRGGIVDIYSTAYLSPLRIEFLGDTVDAIRTFDPATQTSSQRRQDAWVLPAREAIRPVGLPDELSALPVDAEWQAPSWYASMDSLLDYFASPPVFVLDQPAMLAAEATAFWTRVEDEYLRHLDHSGDHVYPTPDQHFALWEAVLAHAHANAWLALESVTSPEATWTPVIAFSAQTPEALGLNLRGTPFTETLSLLDRLRYAGPVLIVARARAQVDRLLALFAEHDLPAAPWTPAAWSLETSDRHPFYVIHGDMSSGFICRDMPFCVVTEEEVFAKGTRHKPTTKSKAASFLASLDELDLNDYVVHVQYGIGRYRGLKRLSVQDNENDYLILEYARGDMLYVPLDRLNQVQRYVGAEGSPPRLDRLGGTGWEKTKARVKKDIEEMAHELVELYASREVIQRGAYSGDRTLLHEFEAAFDYEETLDQLRAVEDIQGDMASTKPMDRLVCGDVGYGKTEVAMRAAFLAIEHNRQVAVLVPTTLLAHQHYDNFSQRFAPFPTRVGLLSRFQSPKETKAVIQDLAAGTLDIVIGTHRLLQKDVTFKNLGLVIVDEEQWFGVRHKERLKQLRTQVDVLTLTATPIPRTLQLAMAGVRDLSVIETPPPGRLAIRTQVLRSNDTVVRDAIVRELDRGGQVYFVHNRVETLQRMGSWLQQLIPQARVVMAHGQMDGRLLESVMLKFYERKADVLVATAIIQSGLDIPNANTIIVNRADMFGLSQLYQLRGRVGRSGQQAYAYFLVPDEGTLTTEAQKRLIAIQQFTELGAGFRIAAADLEIRGAGNLLGRQQSGHIAAIGLDLYMRMVEQAVQQLRGQIVEDEPDPTLHLNVSAYIPEEYVQDAHQRLNLYKRLAACTQLGDLALIHSEVQDRFGGLPEPVERLFEVMQIRALAKASRLHSIETKSDTVVLAFHPKASPPERGVQQLMDRYQHRLRFSTPASIELQIPTGEWPTVFQEVSVALQTMQLCDTKPVRPHD